MDVPLFHVYNFSFKQYLYPSKRKVSRVTTKLKMRSSTDKNKYRPIAVLCVFIKLFESILNNSTYKQIMGQLSEFQHGFRLERSTLTNWL